MVKVFLDSKSHQAIRNQGTEAIYYRNPPNAGSWRGRRLTGLQAGLTSRGYAMAFIDLSETRIDDAGVLMITGRSQIIPFSNAELAGITTFFKRGGGLFLMANHSGFVEPQNQVAKALNLPVTFHEKTVQGEKQQLSLYTSHPISKDCELGLQIRTSCSMTLGECSSSTVLARNEDPDIGDFAVAIERAGDISGRTVVITSGGHISSCDDSFTDLFEAASNATWTLNAIEWLAGRLP